MNPGGEPERDDTGLPPVDIEIPDDARELDRDVQAYYRELRAQRRRLRRRRLGWPGLARDGIILPLLACCMILALITGTLLTVFTATSDQNVPALPGKSSATDSGSSARAHPSGPASGARGTRRSPSGPTSSKSASAQQSPSPAAASAAASAHLGLTTGEPSGGVPALPDADLTLDGQQPLPLSAISGSILVLIPARCRCVASVESLIGVAAGAGAPAYLVATPATLTEVRRLDSTLSAPLSTNATVAEDVSGLLQVSYYPQGLTAILVAPNQSVTLADNLTASSNFAAFRQALVD